jgi:uncharacterized protein (DUF3820 family)
MRLKFGRYQGWNIADVPHTYLRWLKRQPGVNAELKAGIGLMLGIRPRATEVHQRRPVIDYKARQAGDLD